MSVGDNDDTFLDEEGKFHHLDVSFVFNELDDEKQEILLDLTSEYIKTVKAVLKPDGIKMELEKS